MNEKIYENISSLIYRHQYGPQMLKLINKIVTAIVYCTYPVFLFILAYNHDIMLWRALLTPGISFVLVSIFRNIFNAPRPYETLDILPIIKKDTKGKSFPSRHVFSVFVIATTIYQIFNTLGVILFLIGIVLAIIRVLGGVHFPRDVIAGAIIGILCGILGFSL